MSKRRIYPLFKTVLFVLLLSAVGSGQPVNPAVVEPVPDVVLTAETIQYLAVDRAKQGSFTKISQIDIIEHIYRKYKNDVRVLSGGAKIIIPGMNFAIANHRVQPYFKKPKSQSRFKAIMQPVAKLPEIKYKNFKGIGLYNQGGMSRMSIELVGGYVQEIPYTFGASIKLSKDIHGTIRSTKSGVVTEVVFDNINMVHFYPPAFVFFLPKMYVKIACIRRENNDVFGYVIGRPMNMSNKFCAVRYNLSSCSKTSIKNFKMSREVYLRKVQDVSYFGFLD